MLNCTKSAIFILALSALCPASAQLQGRLGSGSMNNDYRAYYDTVLDITWLANASLAKSETFNLPGISIIGQMSWYDANRYIDAMNDSMYLGTNHWRLPMERPLNGTNFVEHFNSNDGTTDGGRGEPDGWIGINGQPVSELGHMYYVNLGLPLRPEIGRGDGSEFGIINNSAPISSLEDGRYYSSVDYLDSDFVWSLDMFGGYRTFAFKDSDSEFVWPVIDGDIFPAVVTPVPLSVPLVLPGLTAFYCFRVRASGVRQQARTV